MTDSEFLELFDTRICNHPTYNWLQIEKLFGKDVVDFANSRYGDFSTNTGNPRELAFRLRNSIEVSPKCPVCGGPVKFQRGKFSRFCSRECALSKEGSVLSSENSRKTCMERYGVEYSFQSGNNKTKSAKTKLERYGDPNYNNLEKANQTKLERYGDPNYNNHEKYIETCLERYGSGNLFSSEYGKKKISESVRERFGVDWITESNEMKSKSKATMVEKYGVEYYVLSDEIKNTLGNNSRINKLFCEMLEDAGIEYETEFPLLRMQYDVKVGDILIELNPFPYHNIDWSPVGNPKDKDYHRKKSELASSNGFRCIHVWDWDDLHKIVDSLKKRETIPARECKIVEVSKKETDEFLEANHLQGTCNGQTVRLGLTYNDELIEIMTFGKPRYDKKYQWELLRLCTKKGYSVVGGASKLMKRFVDLKTPETVISYCDMSKFSGKVYDGIGFKKESYSGPLKHWYRGKDGMHITDGYLMSAGYDRIFGSSFGKGTSNKELMLKSGFVEIYDSGQNKYVYKNK